MESPQSFQASSPKYPYIIVGEQLWQWRSQARQQAVLAKVSVAEVDWVLQALTGLERLALRLGSYRQQSVPSTISLDQLNSLWQKRIRDRIPVQYLIGVAPWRQFELRVASSVLVPRPETELIIDLVEAAIANSPDLTQGHWLDLGTGSGAIALGLADLLPNATIHAVDCSEAALAIARQNLQRYHFTDRVHLYHGSWFNPLSHLQGQVSGLVTNPPYIPSAMLPDLQPEVSHHEPYLALDGGEDGLNCIRELVAIAPKYLKPGGVWLTEFMAGQADSVRNLLHQTGHYDSIQIHPDFAGLDRFAIARLISGQ